MEIFILVPTPDQAFHRNQTKLNRLWNHLHEFPLPPPQNMAMGRNTQKQKFLDWWARNKDAIINKTQKESERLSGEKS